MGARKVRRVFATPFVITVAAGCSKGEPKPPPLRMYQVTHEGDICVVEGSCPKGVDCPVAEPFATECGYRMMSNEPHAHPTRDRTYLYGEIEGRCYTRPFGCSTRDCLGSVTPCMERPSAPLTTRRWTVEVTKGTCKITPERVSSISPQLPAYSMPCPPEYTDDDRYRVSILDEGGCEAREDFECLPNATCNPPWPMKVPCPAK